MIRRLPAMAAAAALVIGLAAGARAAEPRLRSAEPQLRGIWMHANFIRTPAEADQCVDRLQQANFNAVFLLVWYWGGQAAFQTSLCPMLEGVQPGYDPLEYMVRECRRRKIEVHAWFVNGAYGHPTPLHLLDKHPGYVVDTGGHSDRLWYDLGKPPVRRFQSDLMIEALTRYDLDGLHFDFIRYDGPAICYCKYCQTEFSTRYGCGPIEPLRRASFPFASTIVGNPVDKPTTAKVLAQFSDGTPAVATNELGKGRVLLLNWHALRAPLPPVAETLKRALRQWNAAGDKFLVMDTAPNRQCYGGKGAAEAVETLRKLTYKPEIIAEDRLAKLPPGTLLVLADVYVIPDDTAQALEQFVRGGGLLIVSDGPAHSMRNASIQRVLGMSRMAPYINRLEAVQPVGRSDLLPCDDAKIDLEQIKKQREKWAEYRKAGVTELVRDVYRRAKGVKPGVQVTAAVFAGLASAENVFQDWPNWIRRGIVDYVVPMAYTPDNAVLAKQLAEWKTVDPQLERILPGLCIYTRVKQENKLVSRDVDTVLTQYRMCMDQGARGNNFYSLDGTAAEPTLLLTDPLVDALRGRLFEGPVAAYRPPIRVPPADFKTQFLQLCDTACQEFNSGTRPDSYYRDSYAVRALLAAYDLTGKQEYRDTCRRWSDRMIEFQGQMIPKGAYYMRYGRKPGEDKGDWYVGDSSSIALGILATAVRSPDPKERQRYLDSVKLYAKLVIDNYVGPEGGITDGLWSKFDGQWWCSTGIFGSLAFLLYNETGDETYRRIGLGTVDWLNRLDFANVGGPISFEERPPTVIMYMLETYSVALPHLEPGSPRYQGAMVQFNKCLAWMAENQRGRVPTLPWDYHSHNKGAKFGGLPFHMYVDAKYAPDPEALRAAADQELRYIASVLWQEAQPTISQLAVFAMMSYAERVNPGAVYRTRRPK